MKTNVNSGALTVAHVSLFVTTLEIVLAKWGTLTMSLFITVFTTVQLHLQLIGGGDF